MKIIECRGTNATLGQTIGEALREEIQANIAGFLPLDLTPREKDLRDFRDSMKRYLPDVLEQMLHAARAANVTEQQILALNLPAGQADGQLLEQECSNVAFAAGPNGPIWGKNNEGGYPPNTGPVENGQGQRPVCALKFYPDEGIPALCVTFCGWFSGADMMNAEGVATGHSSVGSRFQQHPHHASVLHWLWAGMTKIRNRQDYCDHITALPLRGKGFSQLLVDRKGDMVSGELACPLTQIRWPEPDAKGMNCVNHYQLPQLEGRDLREPDGLRNSQGRQAYLDEAIPDGDQSLDQMKSILRHHGDFSICRHGGKDLSFTEYSMIALPAKGKFLLAHGLPCETEYLELTL